MAMVAKKTGGSEFTPCPAGQHHAVVVDVTPLKKRQTQFGMKDQFQIVFETNVVNSENKKRFLLWSQWLSLSLHEKAGLRKLVKGVLDRDLTPAEEDGFDIESLLGKSCQVLVSHEHDGDKIFTRIAGFIKATSDVVPCGDYKRVINRDQAAAGTSQPVENENPRCAFTGEEAWKGTIVHVGKNKGELLANLSTDQFMSLLTNWWPTVKNPTATDMELHAALVKARDLVDNLNF